MAAKEQHRRKLLDYLSNPCNEFPSRGQLPKILGLTKQAVYAAFSPDELSGIEKEGLEIRRQQYARYIGQADKGLLKRAAEGDPAACRLVYQRFEGWTEKKRIDSDCTVRTVVLDDLDNNKV